MASKNDSRPGFYCRVDKWSPGDPYSPAERELRKRFLAALSRLAPDCVGEWKQAVYPNPQLGEAASWAKKWHLARGGEPIPWIVSAFPGPDSLLLEGWVGFPIEDSCRGSFVVQFWYDPRHMCRSDVENALLHNFKDQMKEQLDQIAAIEAQAPGEKSPEWRELQRDLEWFVRFQVCGDSIRDLVDKGQYQDQSEGIRKSLHRTADRLAITLRKGQAGRPRKNKSPTS